MNEFDIILGVKIKDMKMQLIKIFVEPNANDPRKVKLSAKCPLCGRDNELVVDKR